MFNERDFGLEFRHSVIAWARANGSPCFIWKSPDLGNQNPWDYFVCVRGGKFTAIELKVSRNKSVINFNSLFSNRHHQLEGLGRIGVCEGNPWVVILRFHGRGTKRVIAMRPEICKGLLGGSGHDIDGLVFNKLAIEIPSLGGGLWDLETILKI